MLRKLRNQIQSSSEEEHPCVIHIETIHSETDEPVSKRTFRENKSVKRLEKPIGEKFVEKSAETVDKNENKSSSDELKERPVSTISTGVTIRE